VVSLEGDNLIITGVPLVGVTLFKGDYFDDKWKNLGPYESEKMGQENMPKSILCYK